MALWDKDLDVNSKVLNFCVGNDHLLDLKLLKFDCLASIAHTKMLHKIGVLDEKELKKLIQGLKEIITLDKEGSFMIKKEQEDCHTAIEEYLVAKLGKVGKKIHTGRSRNDQVLVALYLYEKENLKKVSGLIDKIVKIMKKKIKEIGFIEIPGYTHMQKAMPTTIKMWLGSFVDSMKDNKKMLMSVLKLVDQNPLGGGAGFGNTVFQIDKKMTAKELGFKSVMKNPMYGQLSRGKFESQIINCLSMVMFDLNKFATDLIMYSMIEFGFVVFPKEFCTGSSMMPQKNNPDVLELIRAKYGVIVGEEFKVKTMIGNLISGYNRNMQLTKEPLMNSFEIVLESLDLMELIVEGFMVDKEQCAKAMTKELYATEKAYKLVKNGITFRDAYKQIGKKYS